MLKKIFYIITICLLLIACKEDKKTRISTFLEDAPNIIEKQEYLNSPYLTAGSSVYMVGLKNGSFPDLGWPIKEEMGGIWNHPIKLMDGFDIHLDYGDKVYPLNNAESFTNYPFANEHQYKIKEKNLSIRRLQFVPDNTQGIAIQLEIYNNGSTTQEFDVTFTGYADLRPTWLGDYTQVINGKDEATYLDAIKGWLIKDSKNPWFVCYAAASEKPKQHFKTNNNTNELTISNTLSYSLKIPKGKSELLSFSIAGSYKSKEEAIAILHKIDIELPKMVRTKKERYKTLANQTKLSIQNKKIEQTFEWLKYHSDWLPEIDLDIGANLNDYPFLYNLDSVSNSSNKYITEADNSDSNKTLLNLQQIADSFNYALPDSSLYTDTWDANNLAYPILNKFFGISTYTAEKKIILKPQMPNNWGEATLENLSVEDNTISIYFSQGKKSITIRTLQTNWDWSFEVVLPKKLKNDGLVIRLGEEVSTKNDAFIITSVNGEIDAAIYFAEENND